MFIERLECFPSNHEIRAVVRWGDYDENRQSLFFHVRDGMLSLVFSSVQDAESIPPLDFEDMKRHILYMLLQTHAAQAEQTNNHQKEIEKSFSNVVEFTQVEDTIDL
jgi:hypothetical protein